MSEAHDALVAREQQVFAPCVRRWPLALERGQGSKVWDVDGAEFIDLTAGWGVTVIGHCHPALADAIADQARNLIQTTNIVYTRAQLDLAEHLERITPDQIHRSFFVSSGAEATEGALKLAHRATGRSKFVAALGSFHGRTLGAMGVLGQPKYRGHWTGIIREADFVPYGDLAAAKDGITDAVAAVIIEPIQGEGGVVLPPEGYLSGLARICKDAGALLILDEIQTGIGRTGRWLACEHDDVAPDILTLGKGLGGGIPIAAFLASDAVMATVEPGDHGGTYAGNPLCARAAAAVLRVIEEEGLVPRAARLGNHVVDRLQALAERRPEPVEEVRGRGLLIGLVLRDPTLAAGVHAQARERGVLVNLTAERVIRIFPALNIPEDELDQALDILEEIVDEQSWQASSGGR
jgi:predicted acetylornithine/succinylornithine family transaminase